MIYQPHPRNLLSTRGNKRSQSPAPPKRPEVTISPTAPVRNNRKSRSFRFIYQIKNPSPKSEIPKRWKVYIEAMRSKSDSELSSIMFCQSQCFRVVDKNLFWSNMKLLLQESTDTRLSFLVSLHTKNGSYCFDGRSVSSYILHTASNYSLDTISNVCKTCSSHYQTPEFPSNRTRSNSMSPTQSEEALSASHDESSRTLQTQEQSCSVWQQIKTG